MQLPSSSLLLLSTLALLTTAQDNNIAFPTSITPAQSTKAIDDLASYLSSVQNQPAFTSLASVLATAIPATITDDPTDYLNSIATQTGSDLPDWVQALPSSALSYLNSIGQAEISIVSKDVKAKGAAPTAAVMGAAGMAGMVGVVGGAVVLGAM